MKVEILKGEIKIHYYCKDCHRWAVKNNDGSYYCNNMKEILNADDPSGDNPTGCIFKCSGEGETYDDVPRDISKVY